MGFCKIQPIKWLLLMVLTVTELAYRRADGVYIVPIGCLKQ
jgi:hypothetical protein